MMNYLVAGEVWKKMEDYEVLQIMTEKFMRTASNEHGRQICWILALLQW